MKNCKRCGLCCLEVGRTFWKAGNLSSEKPFGEITELNNWAQDDDHEDNGLPCEMLDFEEGQAVCMIEFVYGRQAKPVTCREYPESLGEPCFNEVANGKK